MSTRFAPNTNFNSSKSKSIRTPTKSQNSANQSMMSLSELGEKSISHNQEENLGILQEIREAKADLYVLMEKTKSYSKNTGTNFRDFITPQSQKSGYQRSPYGESLHITDYSCLCTPTRKSKKQSNYF